jgi:hypothetical protein
MLCMPDSLWQTLVRSAWRYEARYRAGHIQRQCSCLILASTTPLTCAGCGRHVQGCRGLGLKVAECLAEYRGR